MNKYFYLIIFGLLISSCKKSFQDQALDAAGDGKVSKEEVAGLIGDLTGDPALSGDKFYTNGKPDTLKVRNYLIDLYKAENLTIGAADIWAPAEHAPPRQADFSLNVYLENSGSMDAYVNGNTAFKDAVYSLLGSFKNDFNGALNLYYLNSKITDSVTRADEQGINGFITTLTPKKFEQKGGNRLSSDMTSLIRQVLDRTGKDQASLLISDFVFSPGSKVNARDYLEHQSIGIRDELAAKLKSYDLAIEVMQLRSGFNGLYYDLYNHRTKIHGSRPYYIWIIGSEQQVSAIRKSGMLEQIKGGGVLHDVLFCRHEQPVNTPFKVLMSGKKGDFQLTDASSGILEEAVPAEGTTGEFAFEIAANFDGPIEGRRFFDDAGNFRHDADYQIVITPITDSDIVTKGYTHKISFSTKNFRKGAVSLYGKAGIPAWVSACNSENDEHIAADTGQMDKTFGFQYLIQGLYDGFYAAPKNNLITQLKINIK
jgi:hypothetical protein